MTVATALERRSRRSSSAATREGTRLWALTKQFYQKRGDAPAWIEDRKPRPQMDELISVAAAGRSRRARPRALQRVDLTARRAEAGRGFLSMKGFNEAEAADLDVWLTYLYLRTPRT